MRRRIKNSKRNANHVRHISLHADFRAANPLPSQPQRGKWKDHHHKETLTTDRIHANNITMYLVNQVVAIVNRQE